MTNYRHIIYTLFCLVLFPFLFSPAQAGEENHQEPTASDKYVIAQTSPYGDILKAIKKRKPPEEEDTKQKTRQAPTQQQSQKLPQPKQAVTDHSPQVKPEISVTPEELLRKKRGEGERAPLDAEMKEKLARLRKEREKLRTKAPPTTIELIEKDVDNGAVDYGKSLVYKAYAIFDNERLPKKYHTEERVSASTAYFKEIRQNYKDLSPEVQEALIPFLVNPLHPKSIFNQDGSYRSFNLFDLIPSAYADTKIPIVTEQGKLKRWKTEGGWQSLTTNNNKIKIWYKRGRNDKQIAEETKKYFENDKIRERLANLMGVVPPNDKNLSGDDGLLDIWFYPLSDYGMTYALEDAKRSASTIVIRRSLKGEQLAATLTHELFHAIQNNFNAWNYKDSEVSGLSGNAKKEWIKKRDNMAAFLSESTATWSEDFVYKGYNTEQEYLAKFFRRPESPLYSTSGTHEYGAYLFHFYYEQKYGPQFIKVIWENRAKDEPPLEAFMKAIGPDFRDAFKEFAMWNWNRDPFHLYKDKVKFPKEGMKFETHPLENTNLISGITAIRPLAADYLTLIEKDPKIRKVRFKPREFNKKKNTAVWAIIKIKNKKAPYMEDWSSDDEKVFCFDDPEEDLERITLIHVNTDEKDDLNEITTVDRSRNPCSPKIELALRINGSESKTEKTSGGTTITKSSSISGSADLSVIFEEKEIYPNIKHPDAPTMLIPTGTFGYDLLVKQSGKSVTAGGSYRPPIGSHVIVGQRYAEGSSGSHSSTWRTTAQAIWKGDKVFETLYEKPAITMSAVPAEDKKSTEYSIYLNVDGRYNERSSSHSSSGKFVDGVITSDPVDESKSDSGEARVSIEIKALIPQGQTKLEIGEKHIEDKHLVFPTVHDSIISYPKAKLEVKGTLKLYETY